MCRWRSKPPSVTAPPPHTLRQRAQAPSPCLHWPPSTQRLRWLHQPSILLALLALLPLPQLLLVSAVLSLLPVLWLWLWLRLPPGFEWGGPLACPPPALPPCPRVALPTLCPRLQVELVVLVRVLTRS
jgi:hypothetical protein